MRKRPRGVCTSAGGGRSRADEDGVSPLHFACNMGREACVRVLVEGGADVNRARSDDATPLHIVCARGAALHDRSAPPYTVAAASPDRTAPPFRWSGIVVARTLAYGPRSQPRRTQRAAQRSRLTGRDTHGDSIPVLRRFIDIDKAQIHLVDDVQLQVELRRERSKDVLVHVRVAKVLGTQLALLL